MINDLVTAPIEAQGVNRAPVIGAATAADTVEESIAALGYPIWNTSIVSGSGKDVQNAVTCAVLVYFENGSKIVRPSSRRRAIKRAIDAFNQPRARRLA